MKPTPGYIQSVLSSFIGVPYRWGGNSVIGGWDCSGMTCEFLRTVCSQHIPDMWAQRLFEWCEDTGYESDFPATGALVFFGKTTDEITHVAVCWDEKFMVEAGGGGKHVANLESATKHNAYTRFRPILYRTDYVAARLPVFR